MKRPFLITEALLTASALVFVILWILYPEGHFDAWLGLSTVVASVLELVRRFGGRAAKNPYTARLKSAADLADLLTRTLTELESITRTDYNQVFLDNQSGHVGRLLAVADAIPRHKQRYRMAIYDGLLGSVYASGRTLNSGNVLSLQGYFHAVPETRSELVVPIKSNDRVVGVLNSESEDDNYFTETLQEQVEQLADAFGGLLPAVGWNPRTAENVIPWLQRTPNVPKE